MSVLRAALRLSWRDAWRAKGRSALIMVMIGLPVLVISTFLTVTATGVIDQREALPGRLGAADARVQALGYAIEQSPYGDVFADFSGRAREAAPPSEETVRAALGPGTRLLPMREGSLIRAGRDGVPYVAVVELDLRDPLADGMYRLDRGRLPAAPGEVVVGPLARDGLDVGSEARLDDRTVRVVGVLGYHGELAGAFVGLPGSLLPPGEPRDMTWLADTSGPVTWDDVRRMNRLGLLVISRAVVQNPPPEDPQWRGDLPAPHMIAQAVLVPFTIVLQVVLLAGPAFAVGLRRRRRELALIAAQGGSPRQLRLIVLADGLLLGVAASALGVAGSIALIAIARPVLRWLEPADGPLVRLLFAGPFDVPWELVPPVAALGVVSGVAAALVPAVQAGRQDTAAVLGGRDARESARRRRTRPLVGLVLVVAGIAATVFAIRLQRSVWINVSALVTQLGLIVLTPSLVRAAGRVAGRLPLPLRLSVRDASRHRTRTASAVAAVMMATTVMSATAISLGSEVALARDSYAAGVPVGVTAINGAVLPDEKWRQVEATVRRELPGAPLIEVSRATDAASGMPVRLAVPRRTCGDGCRYPVRPGAADLPIGDASLLRLLQGRPDPDAAAAFAAGKAVVFDRDLVRDGALTLDVIPRGKKGGERRSITVPAVVAPAADPRHTAVAVLPPAALGDAGLTPRVRGFLLGPAHRPAPATESRLGRDLMTIHQAAALHVERGYERDARPELWALTVAAVVVILGATFAATGLAAADMRPDLATMAAVGAAPRLRRVVVAGQALFITGAGALVGLAAGVVAGLALAWSTAAGAAGARVRYVLDGEFLTAIPPHTPVVEVPWPYLAIVVIGLPPLAALAAGLCTRTRLTLARRLT